MEVNGNNEAGEKQKKKAATHCRHCEALNHKTRRSGQCKCHGWEEGQVRAEMVSIKIVEAEAEAVGVVTGQ